MPFWKKKFQFIKCLFSYHMTPHELTDNTYNLSQVNFYSTFISNVYFHTIWTPHELTDNTYNSSQVKFYSTFISTKRVCYTDVVKHLDKEWNSETPDNWTYSTTEQLMWSDKVKVYSSGSAYLMYLTVNGKGLWPKNIFQMQFLWTEVQKQCRSVFLYETMKTVLSGFAAECVLYMSWLTDLWTFATLL